MGRISNGWEITKQSFHILKQDKEILVFPIIAFILFAIVTAIFFIPLILIFLGGIFIGGKISGWLLLLLFIIYYLIITLIGIYFEAAIVTSATIRIKGNNPIFSDGLTLPNQHFLRLFNWSIIVGIVGLL